MIFKRYYRVFVEFTGKNGNKRSGWTVEQDSGKARSILKNKESRGTDSELLIQNATSMGFNVSLQIISITN